MDPISNLLCNIRNGIMARKTYVSVPYSKTLWSVAHVLHLHGYINGMGLQKHNSFYSYFDCSYIMYTTKQEYNT